ncbi:MAG: hypothetical protein ACRYHQ_13560 [Janthinobacterium lividum]
MAILVAGVFPAAVAEALVPVSRTLQPGEDAILVGMDEGSRPAAPRSAPSRASRRLRSLAVMPRANPAWKELVAVRRKELGITA